MLALIQHVWLPARTGTWQCRHDPVGDVEDLRFGGVHDDQRELDPAEARDGAGAAADRPQPPGDLDQQLVADGAPEAVVDRLETVEVEHEHGGEVPTAFGAGDGLVDAFEGACGWRDRSTSRRGRRRSSCRCASASWRVRSATRPSRCLLSASSSSASMLMPTITASMCRGR